LPVYDTQCEAKIFRVTETLKQTFKRPFASLWGFDVEILPRMASEVHTHGTAPLQTSVYEWPLQQWQDVEGSKVRASDFLGAAYDLLSIYKRYRKFLGAPKTAKKVSEAIPSLNAAMSAVSASEPVPRAPVHS